MDSPRHGMDDLLYIPVLRFPQHFSDNRRQIAGGHAINPLITEDGNTPTTQPLGVPTGLDQNAVQPQFLSTAYRVKINPTSILANGTSTVTVNCSTAHGLATNAQIAVEGLSNNAADGFYSITVTTGTAFTYQTNNAIASGNLLQGNTLIVTALVGLPYGYTQIPLTGPAI